MTFYEALKRVVEDGATVQRCAFKHLSHHSDAGLWSEWIRICLKEYPVSSDNVIYFESRHRSDIPQEWLGEWVEDAINVADVLATNWEVVR